MLHLHICNRGAAKACKCKVTYIYLYININPEPRKMGCCKSLCWLWSVAADRHTKWIEAKTERKSQVKYKSKTPRNNRVGIRNCAFWRATNLQAASAHQLTASSGRGAHLFGLAAQWMHIYLLYIYVYVCVYLLIYLHFICACIK